MVLEPLEAVAVRVRKEVVVMRSVVSGALIIGLVGSGCSVTSDSSSAGQQLSFEDAFADVEESGLDVGDFVSFDASSHVFVQDAVFELARRCMDEAGFEYVPPSFKEDEFVSGFRSPEQLRSTGYAITERDWSDEPDGNQKILAALGPDAQLAWNDALGGDLANSVDVVMPSGNTVGSPVDGCYAEATNDVFGSVGDTIVYEQVRDNLNGLAIRSSIIADPRHIEVAEEWVKCLTGKGRTVATDFDTLAGIAEEFYSETAPEQAKQAEFSLARDDADCLEETGLDTLRKGLVEEYQTKQVESASYNVAGAAAFQQRALERAQKLLAE